MPRWLDNPKPLHQSPTLDYEGLGHNACCSRLFIVRFCLVAFVSAIQHPRFTSESKVQTSLTLFTPPPCVSSPHCQALIFRHPVSTSNVGGASYRLPGVERLRPTMYCTCCPRTTTQQLDKLHAPLHCEPVSATAICRARLAVAWVKYALSCYLGRRTQPHKYSLHPIIKIWRTPFFSKFPKAYSWG
jgi:hypothetical protein